MLSWSRVNCRTDECLRSPSVEKRAVLLVLKNILVYRTEEVDSISMLLPRPQMDCSLGSCCWVCLSEARSVSGSLVIFTYFCGGSSWLANILRQAPMIFFSIIQFQTLEAINCKDYQRACKTKTPLASGALPPSPLQVWLLVSSLLALVRFKIVIVQLMAEEAQGNVYVVEQVEISSDSDTEELLDDFAELEDLQNSLEDIGNLDSLMRSTLRRTITPAEETQEQLNYEPKHLKRLEVVDDFIRNFLTRNNMNKTLDSFQKQWYEYSKGREEVPDAELQNQVLKDQVEQLRGQLSKAVVMSERAKATYDKLLKERDFHRMHHQRVQREKKKLNENIERLNALQEEYSKKYEQLTEKYHFTMKEKTLIKIERDKLKQETSDKKETLPAVQTATGGIEGKKNKFTPFTDEEQPKVGDMFNYKQTVLGKTKKEHAMAVCTVVFHPKKPIIGTGSDDMLWKIWTVNQTELIMSGEGHKDWVSSMRFHPRGHHLLTGSGDSTIKVWDFVHSTCTFTFKDHRQPVWSIDVHRSGDYLGSGSLDSSVRLLDINVGKCRNVFRGHVDSVTSVNFQPFSNLLASASADKTLSLWDVRAGLCVQTFYGHPGSLTGCRFSPKGDRIASCDSTGLVRTWDLKAGRQANEFSTDKKAANCLSVDRSGNILAVGTDDALIFLFNDSTGEREVVLRGHQQRTRVQAVEFDWNSKMLVSGGSDCTYRLWQ